jgi:MFS superfamily sulfate permease-like transporter
MLLDSATAAPANSNRAYWGDFFAGISVAGVLLPEAVAYAAIAGVPAIHALLAALIGLCIYPFFGTSRFAIVAPTSSAAAVLTRENQQENQKTRENQGQTTVLC